MTPRNAQTAAANPVLRIVRSTSRRTRLVIAGAIGTLAAAAVAAWIWWPTGNHGEPVVANNYSLNFKVCFVDYPDDTASAAASDATWRALQQTAATGTVNAERVTIPPGSTDLATYVAGMTQRRCGLIATVGTPLDTAVHSAAAANAAQQFLSISDTSSNTTPNISVVSGSSTELPSRIQEIVAQLARPAGTTKP
ncbi:hypothetical protein [Yinghuangia seranimata]|uniref:hypothetical protein n=1 Tax=Yinghuangia seranimata TaxID=408067 RepID=UPI00248C90C7|nr:hypothetical protein [Yinghuangia seranimata]MDI2130545.1 hypothetical protein [Yinghuangia seranimata]